MKFLNLVNGRSAYLNLFFLYSTENVFSMILFKIRFRSQNQFK